MSDTPTSTNPRRDFRDALGEYATGVAIVTTLGADGTPQGMTINSFASVSLDPPLVLWSVQLDTPSAATFRAAERFAISVLGADQEALARRFSGTRDDRFDGAPMESGATGLPVATGALAVFECRTAARYQGGDHEILVGQVESFRRGGSGPALGFHRGKFHTVD